MATNSPSPIVRLDAVDDWQRPLVRLESFAYVVDDDLNAHSAT